MKRQTAMNDRFAIIDIGSNSVRYQEACKGAHGTVFSPKKLLTTRLASGQAADGSLDASSVSSRCSVLLPVTVCCSSAGTTSSVPKVYRTMPVQIPRWAEMLIGAVVGLAIKEAVCLAERDAHAYLTAIGVASGQHIEVLHADTLYAEFSYKWRKEDTAHYDISNLIFGDFTARIINSCKDTVLYDFMVGGTKPYIVSVDSSKSELKVKCPSDTTGIISALFSGGADSCFCYLQRLNSDGRYKIIQSGVVFSHEAVQEVKYTGLGKGNYMLVMTSTIPGCNDIGWC